MTTQGEYYPDVFNMAARTDELIGAYQSLAAQRNQVRQRLRLLSDPEEVLVGDRQLERMAAEIEDVRLERAQVFADFISQVNEAHPMYRVSFEIGIAREPIRYGDSVDENIAAVEAAKQLDVVGRLLVAIDEQAAQPDSQPVMSLRMRDEQLGSTTSFEPITAVEGLVLVTKGGTGLEIEELDSAYSLENGRSVQAQRVFLPVQNGIEVRTNVRGTYGNRWTEPPIKKQAAGVVSHGLTVIARVHNPAWRSVQMEMIQQPVSASGRDLFVGSYAVEMALADMDASETIEDDTKAAFRDAYAQLLAEL